MKLSFSRIQAFIECPRKYYFRYEIGLRKKEIPRPILEGKLLTCLYVGEIPEELEEVDMATIQKVEAYVDAMKYLNLLPSVRVEVELESENMLGYADFIGDDFLVEIKFGSKPENYLYRPLVMEQISIYALLIQQPIKTFYICPIRRIESFDTYKGLYNDIIRRPNHYFPFYDPQRHPVKWGLEIYRHEIESYLPKVEKLITFIQRQIEMRKEENFWEKRLINCNTPYECEFYQICQLDYYDIDYETLNWETMGFVKINDENK